MAQTPISFNSLYEFELLSFYHSHFQTLKMNIKIDELLKGLPNEFMLFLQNVRDLQFEDKPDYNYLRELLRKMNISNEPLEKLKLDYIDLIEKTQVKNKNNNKFTENFILNNGESKKATKENSKNDSHC